MKISTDDLRNAFAIVDAVPPLATAESSQYVRIKQAGKLTSLALTGSMWAEAELTGKDEGGKWTAYADRRALKAFLSTASAETEIFTKDKLTLKSGQRLEVPHHATITGYESWQPSKSLVLSDEQAESIKVAAKYLPTVAGMETVEAIAAGKKGIFATDTLFLLHSSSEFATENFVPSGIAGVFATLGGKLASDKSGTGIVVGPGRIFQPRSADLDNYPMDTFAAMVIDAKKAKTEVKFLASDLLDVIRIGVQFLFEKAEAAKIESVGKGLTLTIELPSGKFQRSFAAEGTLSAIGAWQIKRLVPWLESAASKNARIECARMKTQAETTVLRYASGKTNHALIFADL